MSKPRPMTGFFDQLTPDQQAKALAGEIDDSGQLTKGTTMTDTRTAFVELAQKRMNKAIKAIRAVAELGNRKNGLQASDVEQFVQHLNAAVESAHGRLHLAVEGEPDFKLAQGGEE